jgi:hypothetical protein
MYLLLLKSLPWGGLDYLVLCSYVWTGKEWVLSVYPRVHLYELVFTISILLQTCLPTSLDYS